MHIGAGNGKPATGAAESKYSCSILALIKMKNPAQKSRVCPIYPYTYEILICVIQ